MKSHHFLNFLLIIGGFFTSCSITEVEPIPPIELNAAVVNATQTAAPFTEVTLDGSPSTGPEGFTYEWVYQGSETVTLSSTTDALVTFTPVKNTTYSFILKVYSSDRSNINETQAQVTVTGAVVLDESVFATADHVELTDIEPTNGMPDYLINQDFTIPTGKYLSIPSSVDITIAIADAAGIIINGSLTNNGQLSLEQSTNDWKGILVDAGTFYNNSLVYVKNAGNAAFSGQSAAAFIITNGGRAEFTSATIVENNIADNGVVITPTAGYNSSLGSFQIADVKYPLMVDMGHYSNALLNGLSATNYDYIHLTTDGGGPTVGSIDGQFSLANRTYYLDGDFTSGSSFVVSSSVLYVKENSGIVGTSIDVISSTVQGLNDATWKGIAASTVTIYNSDIIGGGSAIHDTGSFTSTTAAAIYSTNSTNIDGGNFTHNLGVGVYITSLGNTSFTNASFTNTTGVDISIPYSVVGGAIKTGNSWSSAAPVELRSGSTSAGSTWQSLGAGHAYLASSNILINSGQLNLQPGVHIKFKQSTGLTVTTKIVAQGTMNESILFEGEGSTPGSWAGIQLQGQYIMEYCTINNGGGISFVGTDSGNVNFRSGSDIMVAPQANYKFDNNTLSNSLGYGAIIELGKYDPVTGNATNTYTANGAGTIKLP